MTINYNYKIRKHIVFKNKNKFIIQYQPIKENKT